MRGEAPPLGDGDELAVAVAEPTTRVTTLVPEDELGVSVTAEVTVTSPDLGTRALLQGVVLTNPATGTVVAGARNAPTVSLQWIDEDGVSRGAWTSRGACGADALRAGTYQAHAFAVTVDGDGATRLVLSDPWAVQVVEERNEEAARAVRAVLRASARRWEGLLTYRGAIRINRRDSARTSISLDVKTNSAST